MQNPPDNFINGFTTTLTLWCGTCPHWEYMDAIRVREATAEAKTRGWTRVDKVWQCPKCNENKLRKDLGIGINGKII